jgi:hypothetical protein
VRMGITTGLVAKGNSIKNSAVYKAAQGMWYAPLLNVTACHHVYMSRCT